MKKSLLFLFLMLSTFSLSTMAGERNEEAVKGNNHESELATRAYDEEIESYYIQLRETIDQIYNEIFRTYDFLEVETPDVKDIFIPILEDYRHYLEDIVSEFQYRYDSGDLDIDFMNEITEHLEYIMKSIYILREEAWDAQQALEDEDEDNDAQNEALYMQDLENIQVLWNVYYDTIDRIERMQVDYDYSEIAEYIRAKLVYYEELVETEWTRVETEGGIYEIQITEFRYNTIFESLVAMLNGAEEVAGVNDINDSYNNGALQMFTIDGQKINEPVKGINIILYPDNTTKKFIVK